MTSGWALALVFGALAADAAVEKPAGPFWVEARPRPVARQRGRLASLAHSALPAVVSLTTTARAPKPGRPDGGAARDDHARGLGAGFIINPDGYILTSAHVIEDASEVSVELVGLDGHPEERRATIVGQDSHTDIALLKVEAGRPLPVLPLGSADDVEVADWVVVVGNPFGLTQSVTVGVVSYKGRDDVVPSGRTGYYDYLQTDAPINPGNSGGPILDMQGDVVAIANAVNVAGQGIGFGVPIDVAKAVLNRLKTTGSVHRGWMGLTVLDLTPEIATVFKEPSFSGVIVSEVDRGGPAEEAGLRVGDVIASIDGRNVPRAQSLRWEMVKAEAGERVDVAVRREGQPMQLEVQLRDAPPETAEAPTATPDDSEQSSVLGGTVSDVDRDAATKAGLSRTIGALVRDVSPGGPLALAGVVEGDVVLKVAESTVANARELAGRMAEVRAGTRFRLFVRRGRATLALTVEKP